VGWLLSKLNQPRVIGEMVAGLLLGPSLLGQVAPKLSALIFPADSLSFLYSLSQVGLVLFMFTVGLKLDTKELRRLGPTALVISGTSIILPFVLGALLAIQLYPKFSDDTIPLIGFVLFIGAAMSITAFPVLSRILSERNLLNTRIGTLTVACAAVDDVAAWCLLAGIVAIIKSKSNLLTLVQILGWLAVYLAVMLFVLRPIVRRIFVRHNGSELTDTSIAVVLLCMALSSWATESIGVHALFGAFIAGTIMPREKSFSEGLSERLQTVVVVFLVPLFFAFTGLRTNLSFLSGGLMLFYCGLVLLVAVAGKFGGSMLAA